MRRVARRISQTSAKSFGMYETAARLADEGLDLIHLEVGRPHADTPAHIKQATIAALNAGKVHYSDPRGTRELRETLAAKLRERNAIQVGAQDVLVTNGVTHAAFLTFMATLDRGDEVILLQPHYPQHVGKIELAGAVPVFATLEAKDNYAIRADAIEAKVSSRTRAIVLVNPSNPTGRVYGPAELRELADVAIRHDLIVVADEVYEDIVYDGARHVSIAALDGMQDRTVSMFAFTKSYAMDGWRIGYLAAPGWLTPALLKIAMNDVTHVNTFIQDGARAAVLGPASVLEELVADDRRKRDFVVRSLNQMPGVRCGLPEGTIYVFPDISQTGIPSQELADRILRQAHVVVEAGSFYGAAGEGHLRICFGSESMERLEQAMTRLATFFNAL
jgi:aspartate aminotransferase